MIAPNTRSELNICKAPISPSQNAESSADADIVRHASRCMKLHMTFKLFFPYGSQDERIRIGFCMEVAKTPSYSVACRFLLFVALCYHNPPTLQTDGQRDRQTDKCHAFSTSAKNWIGRRK